MATFKYSKEPKQRYPGDRKWKDDEIPKQDNNHQKSQ